MPDEHRGLRVLAHEQAFLPCYLIRAHAPGGPRTLVYTPADAAGSDAHLERIVATWQAIGTALRTEENDEEGQRAELGWRPPQRAALLLSGRDEGHCGRLGGTPEQLRDLDRGEHRDRGRARLGRGQFQVRARQDPVVVSPPARVPAPRAPRGAG